MSQQQSLWAKRQALKLAPKYKGAFAWTQKVDTMSDAQLIAVYLKMSQAGDLDPQNQAISLANDAFTTKSHPTEEELLMEYVKNTDSQPFGIAEVKYLRNQNDLSSFAGKLYHYRYAKTLNLRPGDDCIVSNSNGLSVARVVNISDGLDDLRGTLGFIPSCWIVGTCDLSDFRAMQHDGLRRKELLAELKERKQKLSSELQTKWCCEQDPTFAARYNEYLLLGGEEL